jgi:hypothetical protein
MLEKLVKSSSVKKSGEQTKPPKNNEMPAILNVLTVEPDDSPCPGCGFGSWWQPRFAAEDSPWKCSMCEPAPSPVLVGRTRQTVGFEVLESNFDPVVICLERSACELCKSSHVEMSSDGYRCATCGTAAGLSVDELFFAPPLVVDSARVSRLVIR